MPIFPAKTAATLGLFAALYLHAESRACTAFELNPADGRHHVVFGRNYDWPVEVGMVIVNKHGMQKTALLMNGGAPAKWTARYGSLTFNQFGRDLPNGGINEAGLVIEVLWLNETGYAAQDSRPAMNALTWIQYQLDTAGSVAEVLASDKQVRVSPEFSPRLHYLVCERSGACASVEFIKGKMVAHKAAGLPLPVLANDTYEKSIGHWNDLGKIEKVRDIGGNRDASLNRFSRAAWMVKAYDDKPIGNPVNYAFAILQEVYFNRLTAWSIVYDDTAHYVYFSTRANSKVRVIDLSKLDFSCAAPMRMMDMGTGQAGDVTDAMLDYSAEGNRTLLGSAMRQTSLTASLPQSVTEAVARHADSATCEQ